MRATLLWPEGKTEPTKEDLASIEELVLAQYKEVALTAKAHWGVEDQWIRVDVTLKGHFREVGIAISFA